MAAKWKEPEDVMTPEEKAEVKARLERAWDEMEERPSEARG